jgi:hypothetical protein
LAVALNPGLFEIQARALLMKATATLLTWVYLKERTPQYGRPVICSGKMASRTKATNLTWILQAAETHRD